MSSRVLAAAVVGATLWFAFRDARPLTVGGIHVYQRVLSPLAARAGIRCRFTPSCSRYAEIVIERDGVLGGGWKAAKRIARCGPWTAAGTFDPP